MCRTGLFSESLSFVHHCWTNTIYVFLHSQACVSFSQTVGVLTVGASLTLTLFVKVLTFAAAVKVACEHWVLLDLDQGVLKLRGLLL